MHILVLALISICSFGQTHQGKRLELFLDFCCKFILIIEIHLP